MCKGETKAIKQSLNALNEFYLILSLLCFIIAFIIKVLQYY